ncbi:transporter substrate-binding domain-containing protein [Limibacter armeniacum]|uniref:transporter substrate-binding domain-containing protein n=1 Tax=Limibacter armeniacum TaxID=466084 RepID=UPI002FE6107F
MNDYHMKKEVLLLFSLLFILISPIYAYQTNEAALVRYLNDQQDKVLIVGIKEDPPFIIKDGKDSFYGISIDLWESISNKLHLVYEFKEYEHVPGLMLALSRKQVDIVLNPMSVSGTRLRQLDVSHPFLTSSMGIAIRNDENNQIQLFISNLFSLGFLKLISLLIVIVFTFGTIVWFVEKKSNHSEFRDGPMGILDGIWWSTVTITTVGYGDKTPKTVLGRIISMVWMFAAISLISSFTATITSKLTLDQLGNQVNTLKDLEKFGRIGAVKHSSSADFLFDRQINVSKHFDSPTEGLEALQKGEIQVFAHEKPVIRYLIHENNWQNSIRMLPATFNRHYFSLLMPKNSSLHRKLNPILVDHISRESWNRTLRRYSLDE